MSTLTAPRIKITHATLRNDNAELHALYDRGIQSAKVQLGETHPPHINGHEAIRLANDAIQGLTAGFFSGDRAEVDRFLEKIEAGVVYVNRQAGATTGAWPGIQPFGGWKASGTTGKAGGGLFHVQQFMREQSQTIVE